MVLGVKMGEDLSHTEVCLLEMLRKAGTNCRPLAIQCTSTSSCPWLLAVRSSLAFLGKRPPRCMVSQATLYVLLWKPWVKIHMKLSLFFNLSLEPSSYLASLFQDTYGHIQLWQMGFKASCIWFVLFKSIALPFLFWLAVPIRSH